MRVGIYTCPMAGFVTNDDISKDSTVWTPQMLKSLLADGMMPVGKIIIEVDTTNDLNLDVAIPAIMGAMSYLWWVQVGDKITHYEATTIKSMNLTAQKLGWG